MPETDQVTVTRDLYKPPGDYVGRYQLSFTILVKGPVGPGDQTRARRLAEAEALSWSEELGVPKPDIDFEMFNSNWAEEGRFSFSAFYMTSRMTDGKERSGG